MNILFWILVYATVVSFVLAAVNFTTIVSGSRVSEYELSEKYKGLWWMLGVAAVLLLATIVVSILK